MLHSRSSVVTKEARGWYGVCTSVSGHRHDYEMIPRIAALAWLGRFGLGGGGVRLGGSSKLTVQWAVLLQLGLNKSLATWCP